MQSIKRKRSDKVSDRIRRKAWNITSPDVPIRIPVSSAMMGTNITEEGIYCSGKVK